MTGKILAVILAGMFSWSCLHAQTASKPGPLTEEEREGKIVFQQRCSICHTPPLAGNKTYGPMLSADSVAGKEAAAHDLIMKGTPRMPGFQYGLQPKEIDNMIAYLKTVKNTGSNKEETNKPQENPQRENRMQD